MFFHNIKACLFSKKNEHIEYRDKKMNELNDEELKLCSELFSQNYGIYSNLAPNNRGGKNVKMPISYYKANYTNECFRIAMAFDGDKLIGHAIYAKKKFDKDIKISWVVQLVVHKGYRGKGIGTRLLHSIWGFSNYTAWGLATANPCTVKVLENATFRRATPKIIFKNLDKIKMIGDYINFATEYDVTPEKSVLKSNFFVDHKNIKENIRKAYKNDWILGDLLDGDEWLAFTFKSQELNKNYLKSFNKLIRFSEMQLKEAYERMNLSNQGWNKHQKNEVEYILNNINHNGKINICDFGCGNGRHSIELAKLGHNVTGIDFVKKNINFATEQSKKILVTNVPKFICDDCRSYKSKLKYDLIISLYDVIGSFPYEVDNIKIIKNANKHLIMGGFLVISVMNMELTQNIAKYKADEINKLPNALLNLKPSNIMQSSGNIFNPEYYVIDNKSKLVYRKEQFDDDGELPAEFIIRDKRYTMKEICDILLKNGFEVQKKSYVQAGKFDIELKSTDLKAKEIFVIAKKVRNVYF